MNVKGKILIVDDEQAVRHTLARILQGAGMDATTAENANQALAFLSSSPFDLVFMDIRMPGISGLEALDSIRAHYPGLPVVLFTALPDLDSAVEALRRGATDYLLKPLKPEVVIDRAKDILLTQARERRKREILAEIESLQGELNALHEEDARPATAAPTQPSSERYLKRGPILLDMYTHQVTAGEKKAVLLPTSFDFLLVLARHAPEVVDYQTLVAEAQGIKADAREAQELVKWHIHHIRQAIESDARNPEFILNERGIGYRLITD